MVSEQGGLQTGGSTAVPLPEGHKQVTHCREEFFPGRHHAAWKGTPLIY